MHCAAAFVNTKQVKYDEYYAGEQHSSCHNENCRKFYDGAEKR